ncbi:hypothetical protein [Thermomonospora umbrina]|uniref:Uncharacterized protein n=1 Tax=Thermomonospora umbrina TaxID=111806 RepID=A0A3D9SZ17_9ACTN|nr:hypothetical protein [Thermomonospora umbrina]REF01190.1 hypothetical protein DFJ69_6790 [Thermomonospora umbrina]
MSDGPMADPAGPVPPAGAPDPMITGSGTVTPDTSPATGAADVHGGFDRTASPASAVPAPRPQSAGEAPPAQIRPVTVPPEIVPMRDRFAVEPTGDERVDAVVGGLTRLVGLPVSGHVEVFEDVHRGLQEVLASVDEEVPAPRGPVPGMVPPRPGGRP